MMLGVVTLSLFILGQSARGQTLLAVTVNMNSSVFEVEDSFVSLSMDIANMVRSTGAPVCDYSSPKLHSLLHGLSPALFRVGGSPADWLYFDVPYYVLNATSLSPEPIVMTKTDWDAMVELTLVTNNRLLFDLNLQHRFGTQWDPSHAIRLFEYCRQKGYGKNLDWELGNEPDAYSKPGQAQISSRQIGADFLNLRRLLDVYPSLRSGSMVGPDVVLDPTEMVPGFIDVAGGVATAVTTHHYYFRGDIAPWNEYINVKHFSGSLDQVLHKTNSIIAQSKHPDLKYWLGETSDSWHAGTAGVTDRFISGFLWLDKLGISAKLGVGVVMRQTFYGHDYSLIDLNLNPNPDYWLSLLHKRLAGRKVLHAEITNSNSSTVKVYAHCTAPAAGYPPGAVTLFALNINNHTERLTFDDVLINMPYEVYLMTPGEGPHGGLLSKEVKLNGKLLTLMPDSSLPDLLSVTYLAGEPMDLPAYTYAFWVFPAIKALACI